MDNKHSFYNIIAEFKLSPSNKVFKDQLSQDAELSLNDIAEIQQMIGTHHFPVLVMTQNIYQTHKRLLRQ